MAAKKYTLKDGVVLRPYGVNSKIDNTNGTDEIFEFLIESGRAKKEDFIIKQATKNTKK